MAGKKIQPPRLPSTPIRPTAAPGVPVPQAYTGPSRNLGAMAQQIGRDRALSEFYKALTQEQWEYDNDRRQYEFDALRDQQRLDNEITIQNNREWLKTGEDGRGIAAPEGFSASNPSKTEQVGDELSGRRPMSMQEGSQAAGQDTSDETKAKALEELAASRKKTTEQVAAEKKAANDEAERDWWGNVAHSIGEGWDKAVDIGDAITPDAVTDRLAAGAKDYAKSDIGQALGDAGSWSLKQLSRPAHAVASGVRAWNDMDEDNNSAGWDWRDPLDFSGVLLGQDLDAGFDDLSFEGIKNVGSKMLEGWNLENDTTFRDVITDAAERNTKQTYHDTLTYQVAGGIASDVMIDPLNLVGVGIVTKPMHLAREGKRLKDASKFADEVADLKLPKIGPAKEGEDFTYSANEVLDMLGGSKKYETRGAAARDAKRVQNNARILADAIGRSGDSIPKNRIAAIQAAGRRVAAQLDAEKSRYASAVVTESAVSRSARAEELGVLPVGATKEFATRIEQQRVIKALQATFVKGASDAEKASAFNKALGPEWAAHPGLSDADKADLFKDNLRLVRKEEPALHREHSALITRVKDLQEVVRKNPSPANKKALDRARTALTRSNKKYNRARADIFMRQARARINRNIGMHGARDRVLDEMIAKATKELDEQSELVQSYVGTTDDFVRQQDLPEGEYAQADITTLDSAFTPDMAKFSSRDQQMRSVLQLAERERNSLYPDLVGRDELDTPIMGIPDRFASREGALKADEIQKHLELDEKSFKAIPHLEGLSPDEADWMEDFAQAFSDTWADEFSRLNNNAQRGANEKALTKGKAEVLGEHIAALVKSGDEDAKLFTEIFRNPNGEAIDLKDAAKKFAYPSFATAKGTRVFQNSPQLAKMVDAPAMSRSEKMMKYIEDPSKIKTEKDTAYIFERFKEMGIPVPNNPEAIYNYVTLNNIALRDTFKYTNVIFAMRFKKAHGIALEDAMELRSAILGNTVRSSFENSTWAKNYPKGMSEARFIHEVTGSSGGAALKRVLDGAPFRITPKADELGFASPTVRPMSNKSGGWKWLYEHGSDEQLSGALKEAGMPPAATLEDVQAQWYDDMHTYLTGLEPAKLKNKLSGIWKSSHSKQVHARKLDIIERSAANVERVAAKSRKDNIIRARTTAFNKIKDRVEKGQQTSSQGSSVVLPHSTDELDTAKAAYAAKKEIATEQIDEAREALADAKQIHDGAEIARLEKRINRLRVGLAKEKQAIEADLKAAREAKADIQKRLREEAILNVANAEIIAKSRGLAFNAVGKQLTIPGTRAMFAAAEKAGGLPVINKFFETWKNSFASQASLLPDEMLYIRNRAISDPSKNIGEHIRQIKNSVGQLPIKARQSAMKNYRTGVVDETSDMLDYHFKAMLPYFEGKVPVGDGVLHVRDINAYLPEKFRITDNQAIESIDSPRALANVLGDANADPVEAIWTTRIAIEQSIARKTMVHSLNETFGVKRGYKINRKDGSIVRGKGNKPVKEEKVIDSAAAETIEKLKDEGWVTVQGMGHNYYFPPDTAESISRLLEMFKPENVGKVGKLIDEATGIWKTSVTIYNIPGYYIRNGIGEVMSAWLAGVNSPKPYYKSGFVWRYVSQDTKNAEALAKSRPELGLKVETTEELGRRHVVTLQNGTVVDVAKVHAWYRDQGLATGFINTEYRHHYNRFKERLHSVPGVQKLSNANENLRQFNENYEDFYRMAHFIDKLGKAPKGMSDFAAAEWAAKDVRKFHFDYTDFTHAEKSKMLRVFPFYKWTRKALPLMSSMLFVKPGKMMAYPKIMEGMSEGLVSSDDLSPGEDHNGFMPNYYGIAPANVTDMWAYQLSGDTGPDAEGDQRYMRMSTPQLDSMQTLNDPTSAAYTLFNPLFKVPFEQLMGETQGSMHLPVANEDGNVDPEDKGFINNRVGHFLRQFPPGQILANYESGNFEDDNLIRLLSGMGVTDVSEAYRNFLKSEGYK